jgi:prevent-host-death family protein
MATWKSQDAKTRFSKFVDSALERGPQVVTRHGKEAAVLVAIEDWNRLERAARPNLKALLLAAEPRFENLVAVRGDLRRRKILPVADNARRSAKARSSLVKRLRSQRATNIGRWRREELYENEGK